MALPSAVAVMTLSNAILFPQAMLPLYIFEPRYRRMLADCLETHRMFAVAMQRPGAKREIPSNIAGLGLVRASVDNKDGTSHLILQGLMRVELMETVRYKPYRLQRIRPLETTGADSVAVDALTAKVLDLVAERFQQGFELPVQVLDQLAKIEPSAKSFADSLTLKHVIRYLNKLEDPDHLADLVSYTLLPTAVQRQTILETTNLEARLKCLIHFLIAEISRSGEKGTHE